MKLHPIPAFSDNYIWALFEHGQALVVDPGDADAVLKWLQSTQLTLQAIFVTHHHADHTGGVVRLQQHTHATVYAPATEWVHNATEIIRVGADFGPPVVALQQTWQVLETPGHTQGHIAYHSVVPGSSVGEEEGTQSVLFCGDTLFSAGCGRLFEGTATDMLTSLTRLASLPDETLVCCAHEYTLSNLRFAQVVEPENAAIRAHLARCQERRTQGHPTLPSTLKQEKEINPFLRTHLPAVIASASQMQQKSLSTPSEVLAALREWKNHF